MSASYLDRDIKCKGCGAKGLNLVRLNGRCDYCISNGIVEKKEADAKEWYVPEKAEEFISSFINSGPNGLIKSYIYRE